MFQERRFDEYELNLENLRKERLMLRDELQQAREKVHSLESVVKTMGGSSTDENSPAYTHQMDILGKQVGTHLSHLYLTINVVWSAARNKDASTLLSNCLNNWKYPEVLLLETGILGENPKN